MKKTFILSSLSFMILILFAFVIKPEKSEMLEIGKALPMADLKMLNTDSKEYNLNEIASKNGLLVIFSCNTCPFVVGNGSKSEGWENRYPGLAALCSEKNIGMALINSNEAKREGDDSFSAMQSHYSDNDYSGYYLVDKNSVLADEFGALTTPHVYLFDASMKLAYRGAIDDNVARAEDVKAFYLRDAINGMVNNKEISPQVTRQLGCSIKRVK